MSKLPCGLGPVALFLCDLGHLINVLWVSISFPVGEVHMVPRSLLRWRNWRRWDLPLAGHPSDRFSASPRVPQRPDSLPSPQPQLSRVFASLAASLLPRSGFQCFREDAGEADCFGGHREDYICLAVSQLRLVWSENPIGGCNLETGVSHLRERWEETVC